METQPPKILREQDCCIDWKNHPTEDENGNPTIEDWTELREEWIIEDCGCDEYVLADRKRCFKYYIYDYDEDLYRQFMRQEGYTEANVAYWGLQRMFDDGWIKSPAFVKWDEMLYLYNVKVIQRFVEAIHDRDMRVKIIKYFMDNADYFYGVKKKDYLPELKHLLIIHSEAARIHREELKKQTAIEITQQQQLDLLKENVILKQRVQKLEQRIQKLERQPRKLEQHFHESVGVAANNTNNLKVHNQQS